MDLKSYIRDIQDFPTAGVVFKDITPLLQDRKAFEATLIALVHLIGPQKIDKVVGMESRGFFFGPLLASHYKAGFVPVRKNRQATCGHDWPGLSTGVWKRSARDTYG